MIIKCTCQNEFMDKTYGASMRVANATSKTDNYRCASCGKETLGGNKKKK